jgi:hypothetical protein
LPITTILFIVDCESLGGRGKTVDDEHCLRQTHCL